MRDLPDWQLRLIGDRPETRPIDCRRHFVITFRYTGMESSMLRRTRERKRLVVPRLGPHRVVRDESPEADALCDVCNRTEALLRQHLDGHQCCAKGQSGSAQTVVGGLGDCSGDVRTVTVVVVRFGRIVDEVPAAVAPRSAQVGPSRERSPIETRHSGVDDGDGHPAAAA